MFLSAYRFDGAAAPLPAAYDRLPQPRIEPLGEVHDAVVRPSVSS